MIKEMCGLFITNEQDIKEAIRSDLPRSYGAILKTALSVMYAGEDYGFPDYENIHMIDDGDYQGTLLFVIPEKCYQPSTYYVTKVYYGSCSGCDTLQAILEDSEDDDTQVNDLYTLALHMIQKMEVV